MTPSRKFMLVAAAAFSCAVELAMMVTGLAGYVVADLASSVSHWGIDNNGDASTPVFGPQIEAFQGHSQWPWMINRRQVVNNLHELARAVAFSFLPFILLCIDATGLCFFASFGFFIMMKQFHLWGHCTKFHLQDVGMHLSQTQHRAHHHPLFNNNYCFVSGIWNSILNEYGVFKALEMAMYYFLLRAGDAGVSPDQSGQKRPWRTERGNPPMRKYNEAKKYMSSHSYSFR